MIAACRYQTEFYHLWIPLNPVPCSVISVSKIARVIQHMKLRTLLLLAEQMRTLAIVQLYLYIHTVNRVMRICSWLLITAVI